MPDDERDFPIRGWVTVLGGGFLGMHSTADTLVFLMAMGLVALGAWVIVQRRREQRFVAIATTLEPDSILERIVELARAQGWRNVGLPSTEAMTFDAPPEDWSDSTRRVRIVARAGVVFVNSIASTAIHPVANARNIELVRAALDGSFVDAA